MSSKVGPPEEGIQTVEAKAVACQCGHATFEVKKRSKTAVALVCSNCGTVSSVKGNVATVRVKKSEVLYAFEHQMTGPDPEATSSAPPREKKKGESDLVVFKAAMTKERAKNLNRALGICRIQNWGSDGYRDQTWVPLALEYFGAEFMSGAEMWAINAFDEAEEANRRELEKAEAEGKSRAAAKKRARNARVKVIETRFAEHKEGGPKQSKLELKGADKDTKKQEEELSDHQVQEEVESEEDELEPVLDGGRLEKAVVEALEEYQSTAADGDKEVDYWVATRSEATKKGWTKEWLNKGGQGHLLRVLGDDRTVDSKGFRAEVLAWVSEDIPEIYMDFGLQYSDTMDDLLPDANVEVIEIVLSMKADKAGFADKKEMMK